MQDRLFEDIQIEIEGSRFPLAFLFKKDTSKDSL